MTALIRIFTLMGALTIALWTSACRTPDARQESPATASALASVIQERLASDPVLRDRFFVITEQNGVITISGVVRNESERMRVISTVRGTPGVSVVNDRLRVLE